MRPRWWGPLDIMDTDPRTDASDLVTQRFPGARWAVLTGSVLTAARTPGSDLDIVVLVGEGNGEAPFRESLLWRGWPVELFVHTRPSLTRYLGNDLVGRRPTLHRMLATGAPIAGDVNDAMVVQAECAAVLTQGPPPLPAQDLDQARYALTDLLDDLTHSSDPAEAAVLATCAWLATAQLACDVNRHWRGGGKWIARELHDLDPDLAHRWLHAHANPTAITALAHQILALAGGPLFAGYRATGSRDELPGCAATSGPAR
jgi:hypothetical protein